MKLIALVDGSPYSASVCDHAAWAAGRLGAGVEIFHMLGRRERPSAPADLSGNLRLGARSKLLEELARSDAERARLSHARGRLILEDAAERLRGRRRRLGRDPPAQRRSRRRPSATSSPSAAMVVIGKRGEAHGFALDHLGSNLERVLRSATQARCWSPAAPSSRSARYLVAFDGSPSIVQAVDEIAARPAPRRPLLPPPARRRGRSRHARPPRRRRGPPARQRRRGHHRHPPRRPRGGHRRGVETDAFHLLVIGAYGQSRIRHLIIGSTSAALVRACKVPVLLFR